MTASLVEQLRACLAKKLPPYDWPHETKLLGEAADEIERAHAEIAHLRCIEEAARPLVEWLMGAYGNPAWPQGEWNEYGVACRDAYYEAAKPQASEEGT